jgi:hypothetical protein
VWTAPLVDGPATLGVQVDGQLVTAGVEVAASTPSRIRLPLVTNELLTMPLTNGYFSDGLNGWGVGRGGFMGHGSGLPVGRLFEGGNPRILLGDATAISGTIPVGYGYLNQTFVVGARYLEINYRMFTEDLILGGNRYFDTFEVALNTFPDQITDMERTARGCQTAANPGSVVVPGTGGLVFCAGNPGEREGKLQETGWRTARLDLAAWRGRKITLFMTLWSREYDAPYQNNQAFYNSWVFVDDIRETESAANELQSLETLWPLVLGGSESTPSGLLPRR